MALRIPAAQVPFVRQYFHVLSTLAENSTPGEDLVVERDLLSSLTNSQVEGFKRLVNYYHTLPNNQRNNEASNNSTGLLAYYRNQQENGNGNAAQSIVKYFKGKTEDERELMIENLKVICYAFSLMDFAPNEYEIFFSFAHLLDDIGYLFGNLYAFVNDKGPQEIEILSNAIRDLRGGSYDEMTPDEISSLTELITRYCEDSDTINEKLEELLPKEYAHNKLLEKTALQNNNLKIMTNYLGFGQGGKRKTRKVKGRARKH